MNSKLKKGKKTMKLVNFDRNPEPELELKPLRRSTQLNLPRPTIRPERPPSPTSGLFEAVRQGKSTEVLALIRNLNSEFVDD